MATPAALQPAIRGILAGSANQVPGGVIPLTSTIFRWQSLLCVVTEILVVTTLMYFAAPTASRAKTAQMFGNDLVLTPLVLVLVSLLSLTLPYSLQFPVEKLPSGRGARHSCNCLLQRGGSPWLLTS